MDNTFIDIGDFEQAQQLSDRFDAEVLLPRLDQYAQHYCPVIRYFAPGYHWSLMQVEYATDIVFKTPEELQALQEDLELSTMHEVKPLHIAGFLGRPWHGRKPDDIGSRFKTRSYSTIKDFHLDEPS